MSWSRIQEILNSSGVKFELFGAAPLQPSSTIEHYESWLHKNYHGQMKYLETHLAYKKDPQLKYPAIRSALSLGFSYLETENADFPLKALNIARYARRRDYHFWLKERLDSLINHLQIEFPQEIFISATDSSPLLERDIAHRAGLGWFGKNTCLIHPRQGSFLLLGEILTSLDLTETKSKVVPDFCGTCTRCMDACPTEAFVEPRVLNATKCISYGNIESRTVPPVEERKKWGGHFFGCDICQSVCPWNKKPLLQNLTESKKNRPQEEWLQHREQMIAELHFILSSSGKQLGRRFAKTPLQRAGPFGLRRNALIVAGNLRLTELKNDVQLLKKNDRLGELAQWCLNCLES